jgi:two-component system response regulator FixJ
MSDKISVALIDDDDAILDSLFNYLRRRGFTVTCFRDGNGFLTALDAGQSFDVVVSDVMMPGMTGLELQHLLARRTPWLPLIVITGHGDIDMAVSTIKAGAFDFMEKPIDDRRLALGIGEAAKLKRDEFEKDLQSADLAKRYAELSDRQRQVMDLAVQGQSNKEIAAQLGISPRTVEHYRESAMERMQASKFVELVQMAIHLKADRQ